MPLAYKFTDRHMRRYPALLAIAIEYVKTYDGDFAPLVDAHSLYMVDGTLTVPVARKVLNCLRVDTDPWVKGLREQAEEILASERRETADVIPINRVNKPERASLPTNPRLGRWGSTLHTRVRIKAEYIIPAGGSLLHKISTTKAPECSWSKYMKQWRPRLLVHTECHSLKVNPFIAFDPDEANGRCKRCFPEQP